VGDGVVAAGVAAAASRHAAVAGVHLGGRPPGASPGGQRGEVSAASKQRIAKLEPLSWHTELGRPALCSEIRSHTLSTLSSVLEWHRSSRWVYGEKSPLILVPASPTPLNSGCFRPPQWKTGPAGVPQLAPLPRLFSHPHVQTLLRRAGLAADPSDPPCPHPCFDLLGASPTHPHCVSLTVSPALCLPHCVSLTVSPSLCLPHCVSRTVSPALCLPHCVSLTVSPSLCLPHRLSLMCLPHCIVHCVSLTVSPTVSTSLLYLTPASPSVSFADYGAVVDGTVLATPMIIKALEDIQAHGGGSIFFPAGLILTGTRASPLPLLPHPRFTALSARL
jgi:hypothetical protein